MDSRRSLPVHDRLLRLRAIEDLLELADAMAHTRVHIRLGALDVIMEVVAEELDVRDRARRDERVRKVAREEHERHVADVLRVLQPGQVPDLERRRARRVQHLRRALDRRQPPRVDEFLGGPPQGGRSCQAGAARGRG